MEPQERELLLDVRESGGRKSVEGLELREMVRVASALLSMQRRGLVIATVQFVDGLVGQPRLIDVELTEKGRRATDSEQAG